MGVRFLKSLLAYATIALGALLPVLIFTSWLLSAVTEEGVVRSLLTSEGIRWFFSSFVDNLDSPWQIWLVLLSFTVSAVRGCGISRCRFSEYRQRIALWLVGVELVLFVVLMLLLTLMPHGILLSVTGHLFPGPFAKSLFPYTCFAVCVMSVSFAWMSGKCHDVVDTFELLTADTRFLPPLLLLYVFAMQLMCSFSYVFNVPLSFLS